MSFSEAYEEDIQRYILTHPEVFRAPRESSVVLEKKLPGRSKGSVIADVAIFSSDIGSIGIEIKTAHDSTKRLRHQLEEYMKVFTYVYVFCADNQYEHVYKILEENKFGRIGLITYGERKGTIIPGEVRKARYLRPDPRNLYRMMWKKELVAINNQITSRKELAAKAKDELGMSSSQLGGESIDRRLMGKKAVEAYGLGFQRMDGKGLNVNSRTNKEVLIGTIFRRLGTLGAAQLALDIWSSGTHTPEKVIRYYHFGRETKDYEFKQPD